MFVAFVSSMRASPSFSITKPSPPLAWKQVVQSAYFFQGSMVFPSILTSCTLGVFLQSKVNQIPETNKNCPLNQGQEPTDSSRASLITLPVTFRTTMGESMILETLEYVILPTGMRASFLIMPALMKAQSASQYFLTRSAKKLPQLPSCLRILVNLDSSSTSVYPITQSYFLYSSIRSSTYFLRSGSTSSKIGTLMTSQSMLTLLHLCLAYFDGRQRCNNPTLLKFVPDLTTRVPSMSSSMITWSCPPRTKSTPLTLAGNYLSAAFFMWVRAITISQWSDFLRYQAVLLANQQQSSYQRMLSYSQLRTPIQSAPAIPMMPILRPWCSLTIQGLPSPRVLSISWQVMLPSSQGKLQLWASLRVCQLSKSNSWFPQQATSMLRVFMAWTICQPFLMLVRVEGEKQSPEKRVSA